MKTRIYAANFHPLEVVSRYRDSQLQVTENLFAVEHCVMSTITYFRFFTALYYFIHQQVFSRLI